MVSGNHKWFASNIYMETKSIHPTYQDQTVPTSNNTSQAFTALPTKEKTTLQKHETNLIPLALPPQTSKGTIKYMQRAYRTAKTPITPIRVNVDGGANRSITNDITILSNYKNIKKYSMDGIAADGPAIQCTGKGLLPWCADNGDILFVQCYCSANAVDTIISPTDVIINDIQNLYAWGQYSNVDERKGNIIFHRRDQQAPITYTLYSQNGLWYHDNTGTIHQDLEDSECCPKLHRLTQATQYELYHQRFGHPGERTMSILHHHIDDVPNLQGN